MSRPKVVPIRKRNIVLGNVWKRAHATVVISGDVFDPAAVTAWLELAPSQTVRKGEKHGRGDRFTYRGSGWYLRSTRPDDEPLDAHVDELLRLFADKADVLTSIRTELGATTDLSCFFEFEGFNAGFVLDPPTLVELGRLGLRLSVDIYAQDYRPEIGPRTGGP